MGDFFKQLSDVWPLVMGSPWEFAMLFAIVLLAGWAGGRFMFAERLRTLEGRIAAKDERIADYKEKLDGATPDEARRRLDEMELRLQALTPRRLPPDQAEILVSTLSKFVGSVDIAHDLAASDSKAFVGDLAVTFRRAGWTVNLPVVMGISNHPHTGLAVEVADSSNLQKAENAVIIALKDANIPFDLRGGRIRQLPHERDVQILVTTKL